MLRWLLRHHKSVIARREKEGKKEEKNGRTDASGQSNCGGGVRSNCGRVARSNCCRKRGLGARSNCCRGSGRGSGRGATTEHGVADLVLVHVDVALPDQVEGGSVDTLGFLADPVVFEEQLRAAEALVADGDDLIIRQLILLLELEGFGNQGHFFQENLHQEEDQHEESPSA